MVVLAQDIIIFSFSLLCVNTLFLFELGLLVEGCELEQLFGLRYTGAWYAEPVTPCYRSDSFSHPDFVRKRYLSVRM